jgi:type I restriction enzyme, S subunit
MSQWPMVPLREVLTQHTGYIGAPESRTYPKLSVKLYGKGVVLDTPTDGAGLKMKRHQLAKVGQVILSEIWGKKGAIGFVPQAGEGALCTSHFFLFDVTREKLLPKWLEYIFKANYLQEQLDLEAKGTTGYAAVRPAHLLKATIPLPPLAEQRRLVERIDALAGKIEEAKRLRRKADEEAVLLAARSFEDFRRRLLEKTDRVARLGEIAKVTAGGTPSRDNPAFWSGTIPWIKTGELLDGDISTAAEHITDAAVLGSSAKLFPIDTVLVALYGQGQTRGRTGRLLIPSTTNQACAAVLPCDDLRPRYVQYWLRSLYREMREENHGGAQPNWNGQMIKDIRIAVPSLDDQESLVNDFDIETSNFQRLSEDQGNIGRELNAMLPAILDRVFRGEL